MSVTLFREEEHARRHPRYRIPVSVELNGWVYPAQEWSIESFTLVGVHDADKLDGRVPVKFIFRFDGFSTSVDLRAEIIHYRDSDKRLECRFHNPSNQQIAVLRTVIDAYLAGEFVAMGDLIYVVRQDPTAVHREGTPADSDKSMPARLLRRFKRWFGLAALSGLFLGLLAFTAWVLYQRLYVIEGLSAVVSAPLVVIRAPQPSYFEPVGLDDTKQIATGEPLAFMELIGGGATTIDSPCDCQVLNYHILPRQFVGVGEPVASLLPQGKKPFISAQFDVQQAQSILVGDAARIRLMDGQELGGKVTRLQYSEALERRISAPLNNPLANIISYTEVIITPDSELALDILGTPVTVSIDTFRGKW